MIATKTLRRHTYRPSCTYLFTVQYYEWYGQDDPSTGNGRYKPKGGRNFAITVNDSHGSMYWQDEMELWFKDWLNKNGIGEFPSGKYEGREVYSYYELLDMERKDKEEDITQEFDNDGGFDGLRKFIKEEALAV